MFDKLRKLWRTEEAVHGEEERAHNLFEAAAVGLMPVCVGSGAGRWLEGSGAVFGAASVALDSRPFLCSRSVGGRGLRQEAMRAAEVFGSG